MAIPTIEGFVTWQARTKIEKELVPRSEDVHPGVTLDLVLDAAEREMFGTDNPGFCLACGEEQEGCEPDAIGYECEQCEAETVYGAAEILMRGLAH